MFDSKPFARISTYCNGNKITKIHEKLLYAKFVEEYNDLIIQPNGQPATPEQEETLINTLLSKNTLDKNFSIVKSEVDNEVKDKTRFIEILYKAKNSGWAIIINIISTMLYTILLIFFFAMAEKDIKPIMQQYLQPSANITEPNKP
jgi:hypothetical protein